MPPARRTPLVWRAGALAVVLGVTSIWLASSEPNSTADRVIRVLAAVSVTGLVVGYVVRLLSRRTRAVADLTYHRNTDALTDLPNRHGLVEAIAEQVDCGSLLLVDLDRFTTINDSLGPQAGDELLIRTAQRIADTMPSGSTIARLASDEYAVVVAEPEEIAADVAESLREHLAQPYELAGSDVVATASIGLVGIDSGISPDELLRRADAAMRHAKQLGGNDVARFHSALRERATARLAIETALRQAIERDELSLHHQPIVELDDGRVSGFEALLRWQRIDGSTVGPAEFVPIAERTGSIVAIGAWVLRQALLQLRSWIDDGTCRPGTSMSVNVSACQLAEAGFAATVAAALGEARLPGSVLWLEITETAMISEPDQALDCLARVRDLGVRVAIDDFGTGFSSLSLLQRFPLQRVKIDRDFVAGVATTPSDTAIVRTIIAMARSLNLDLVAEGVETVAQLQVLADLGCDRAQGYLLSHPLPAAQIPAAVAGLERLGRYPGLRPSVTV